MAYGYTLTAAGRTLLLQLQTGNSMTISRITVGDGEVPDGTNPATLKNLVHEVERSQATCTVPIVEADTLSFEIEYRNKWDAGTFGEDYTDPIGLTEGFWLKEYAVFALDASGNEIMLYYANLGDFPEAVARWNGRNLVSKRYPVSITIVDDDTDVQLGFPVRAFIKSEYLEERLAFLKSEVGASKIGYDNSKSELEAKNVQNAIDALSTFYLVPQPITHTLCRYPMINVMQVTYGAGMCGAGETHVGGENISIPFRVEYANRDTIHLHLQKKLLNPVYYKVDDNTYVLVSDDEKISYQIFLN